MFLVLLAMLWAAFLIPRFRTRLAEGNAADSIGNFRRQLSVLERANPVFAGEATGPTPMVRTRPMGFDDPMASSRSFGPSADVRRRRKDILKIMLMTMGTTLIASFVPGLDAMLLLHVLVDLLFVAYIGLLIRARNLAAEREMKVRFLPPTRTPSTVSGHALVLQSQAN